MNAEPAVFRTRRALQTRACLQRLLLLVLPLVATAAPVAAQQDARGLSFVAGMAYEWGGPGPSLVQEMTAAGLNDVKTRQCYGVPCVSEIQHPFYFNEGLNVAGMLGFRYRFRLPFSVEVLFSNSMRGHAEGYNEEGFDHLVVTYSSILLNTSLGAHIGPLRLGLGPVWNRTTWGVTRVGRPSRDGASVTVGGMVSGSLEFPLGETLVALKAGVRENPSVDLGAVVQTELDPAYRTYFLGLTIAP